MRDIFIQIAAKSLVERVKFLAIFVCLYCVIFVIFPKLIVVFILETVFKYY